MERAPFAELAVHPHFTAVRLDDVRRPDATVAAGRVLAQEPAAGSISREQRTVRLVLSAGPQGAVVPALVGESERAAQIVEAFRAPLNVDGIEIYTTASVGIAVAVAGATPDDLIREADVVVEAMRPGGLARRGLTFERMQEINPSRY